MHLKSISLALGVVLTACGGGGGESTVPASGQTNNGNGAATVLALESNNYVLASSEAVSSSLFVLETPSFATGVESANVSEVIGFGLKQVPSLRSWFNGASIATGVIQSVTEACTVSGTISAVATDADNNGVLSAGDSVALTASNCKENGSSIFNGAVTFNVVTLSGNLDSDFYNASLKLTFGNFSASTSASGVVANGDITFAVSARGVNVGSQTISSTNFAIAATYGAVTYNRSLSNFSASVTTSPNLPTSAYKTTATVSGTIMSSALSGKTVTIATLVPFVRLSTNTYPSSGQGTLTGSNSAKVRFTTQNSSLVLLELDSTGDGIYETSTNKSWNELS